MPQASSRAASLHRQEMLAKEKKLKEKREGKRSRGRPSLPSSFPSTIDSSVSVGDAKVKRRRLSLQQRGPKLPPSSSDSLKDGRNGENNENEQPNSIKQGPTPYIQVVKERGGQMSPPQTRSAKKKKPTPQFLDGATPSQGVMLFSPPNETNQELHEQRLKEEEQRQEEERVERIRRNREKGNLIVISLGSGESTGAMQFSDEKQGDENEQQESLESPNQSHDSSLSDERANETVSTLSCEAGTATKSNKDEIGREFQSAMKQINDKMEHYTRSKQTIEEIEKEKQEILVRYESVKAENETLKGVIGNLNEKIASLETEMRNLNSKILEEKVDATADKTRREIQIENLRKELQNANKQLEEMKGRSETQVRAIANEKEACLEEKARLDVAMRQLQEEHQETVERLAQITTRNEENKKIVDGEVEDLRRQVDEKQSEMQRCKGIIDEFKARVVELEEHVIPQKEKEMQNTMNAIRDHESTISELHETIKELEDQQREADAKQVEQKARLEEKNDALSQAKLQLQQVEQEKHCLEETVTSLRAQLESEAEAQAVIRQDNSTQSQQLSRATQLAEDFKRKDEKNQERIEEMERKLASLQNDLKEQKPREEALYQRLQVGEEIRRELHAKVMQLMGNIRVFVRVRPALNGEPQPTLITFPDHIVKSQESQKSQLSSGNDLTKKLVEITEPKKDRGGLSDRRKKWRFGFDEVFGTEATQNDLWRSTKPMVQSALDGFNSTIFAYGATGSGKTFSLLGNGVNCNGLIGRSIDKLFDFKGETELNSEGRSSVTFSVEVLEVYNEEVRDLLTPGAGKDGKLDKVKLTANSKEGEGNPGFPVETKQAVLDALNQAQKRRCVAATNSNEHSSRSHLIIALHIKVSLDNGVQRTGKLNICDLAGNERLGKSGTNIVGGARLKETQAINTSLMALSNVIESLQAGHASIPFRDSKLTFLLRDSLTGDSKTLAIICCSPLDTNYNETLCSLRFAEKANRVELKKSVPTKFSC